MLTIDGQIRVWPWPINSWNQTFTSTTFSAMIVTESWAWRQTSSGKACCKCTLVAISYGVTVQWSTLLNLGFELTVGQHLWNGSTCQPVILAARSSTSRADLRPEVTTWIAWLSRRQRRLPQSVETLLVNVEGWWLMLGSWWWQPLSHHGLFVEPFLADVSSRWVMWCRLTVDRWWVVLVHSSALCNSCYSFFQVGH